MTLQEFYGVVGGNADEVLSRLMNEKLVKKFLFKFSDDPSYELLVTSVEGGDWETAFRAAHTIKGLCMTLGLGNLAKSSSELTELFRGGFNGDKAALDGLYAQVKADYDVAYKALEQYKQS